MKSLLFSLPMAAFLIFGMATATYAQTEALVISSTTMDQKAKATPSKAYIKEDKMVVETGNDQQSTVLFDAGTEIFYIINHKKKEYTSMTRENMEAFSAMMKQQMAALEKQLEMMPESQRAMIREKMSAAFGGSPEAPDFSLEEKGVQVKGWKTDKYVGNANGKKTSEIYVASFSELGQDPEDFQAMGKFFNLMKEFMQGMTKNMPALNMGFFSEGMPDYKDGIPVKSIMYNSQQEAISTSTIESIREEEVDEHIFTIPENYQEKEIKMNGQ